MSTTNKNTWPYPELKKSKTTTDNDTYLNNLATQRPGEFTYGDYEKSDAAKQKYANVEQFRTNNKPGDLQFSYQNNLNDIVNQINNGEKFSYDLNGDALYQQYKDQYMLQGQKAMMDTMGQAAAMTGGYGNSYAQSVGQQAYQGYLQQLNDKIPELYQLALDQYNRERQDLYNLYGMYSDLYDKERSAHRDSIDDYWTELKYLTEDARSFEEQEYNLYSDKYDRAYNLHSDKVNAWNDAMADAWKQKEFDEAVRQFDVKNDVSGSSGYIDVSGGGYTAPSGWSTQDIQDFQKKNGLSVDGIWGPKSQAKYDEVNDPNRKRENSVNPNHIKSFKNGLHSEAEHDAIMRDMYGSYRQYVAEQIEKSRLTDAEKAQLIAEYGIQESDTNYKKRK